MRLATVNMAFCCWRLGSYMEPVVGQKPSQTGESEHLTLSAGTPLEERGGQGDADVEVRHGVLFQSNTCPQAITSAQAQAIADHEPLLGNRIDYKSQPSGRTGNRFECMSQFFSMAYCCRSKLLTLPAKDGQMPSEKGHRWKSKHRWYDFSDAKMDLLPEFADLSSRPDVCIPKRADSGVDGYNLKGVHPDLQRCLNKVFIRGCEAEYLGSMVDTDASCRPKNNPQGTSTTEDNHQRRLKLPKLEISESQPSTALEHRTETTGTNSSQSAGSLAIHLRSGDLFDPKGARFPGFGQPPLKFYLDAIASKPWTDVSILTFSTNPGLVNPTYKALGVLNASGILGPNVHLHNERSLLEDVRAMLCADALVASRSSLHFLTFAHTRASTFYLPDGCGPGEYMRQDRVQTHGLKHRTPDNATLLILEKPGAEVYGIQWETERSSYPPYEHWDGTDKQLLDMVVFDGVKGLERCSIRD